jgi:type 1 glutamine amidotransferase
LSECDLLVLLGLHWTGRPEYRPPGEVHKRAFERYVTSGKPILAAHDAIASYDDWPRFGELVGFTWVWGRSSHSSIAEHTVRVLPTGHPIIEAVTDYRIVDELYCDIQVAADLEVQTHAEAEWRSRRLPMVMTGEGGRAEHAGKTAYLANGHDLRAFECPAIRRLWVNAVTWCLS